MTNLGYKHAKHNYPQCEGSYGLDLDDRYAARNQTYLSQEKHQTRGEHERDSVEMCKKWEIGKTKLTCGMWGLEKR